MKADAYPYINHHAETPEAIAAYCRDQSVRLDCYGVSWLRLLDPVSVPSGHCYRTLLHHTSKGTMYASYYLPPSQRGKGVYREALAKEQLPILTTTPCNLQRHLTDHPHTCLRHAFWDSPAYQLIERHYGQRVATRSHVPLMRHIDEGIWILHQICKDLEAENLNDVKNVNEAVLAYALHPLVQDDDDLMMNFHLLENLGNPALYALEYRNRANAYLSSTDPLHCKPDPGPLRVVKQMLIADKVQNFKDFELYHKETHPNSARLEAYFREWLDVLGVSMDTYRGWADDLTHLGSLPNVAVNYA